MKFYAVEQGSLEWYRLRLGRPTASNFHKIVTPTGKASGQAQKYLYRLVCERLLNETADDEIGFVKWVGQGKEREPDAVRQFELVNDVRLEPGGFVTTNDGRLGASPDRLLRSKRITEAFEFKCPAPWTQLRYLLEGPEADYRPQVQGHLLVGDEFEGVHFYAYHPQTPPFHWMTLPDRPFQAVLASALDMFCDVLDTTTERARSLGIYVVSRNFETPGERAYQADEDAQLKLVNPEADDDA
jgi:hypothetical protein